MGRGPGAAALGLEPMTQGQGEREGSWALRQPSSSLCRENDSGPRKGGGGGSRKRAQK